MKLLNTNSKIVILGGGTAGWLTALFIQKIKKDVEIVLIEDPTKPPIIAGESGTTTFVTLLDYIGIDKNDFIRSVNATPKLGGKFTDWNGVGTEFIHALQTDYAPWLDGWTDYVNSAPQEELNIGQLSSILNNEGAKDLYLKTLIANKIPLSDAFFAKQFIDLNKVPYGHPLELPVRPMWHFESRSTAAFLKEKGLSKGIKLIEGAYQESIQDDRGFITSLRLNDDRIIDGDWFFDCSGFARLLLEKVIGEPIIDYSNYFPAKAVVAWWDDPCYCVTTNAIAMKYGWSWNINLKHRSGNGYLYDPDHLSLDQAIQEAELRFNKKIDPIANFNFQPGIMRKAWRKNVIAIGLSSGFLEPLEANGVAIIIESLYALEDHWDTKRFDTPESTSRFNQRIWEISEDIKDFLALHYRGHRRDTEFWKSHGEDSFRIPDTLKHKLLLWEQWYKSLASDPYFNGYSPTAWLMVIQGLDLFDTNILESVHERILTIGQNVFNRNINKYKQMVEPFPSINDWIDKTA